MNKQASFGFKVPVTERKKSVIFRALSLGAGTQSSVLALLLARDDERLIELNYCRPDLAIFADTGFEPRYVYDHLDWLEEQLNYPLVRVSAGDMRKNLVNGLTPENREFVDIPLFTEGSNGKRGMMTRQCTSHYKIKPINKELRLRAGGEPGKRFPKGDVVETWMGISLDEVSRMKPAKESWIDKRYPLVELGMDRQDCRDWFAQFYPGRILPRSACVICPYRSDKEWRELKENEASSFDDAIAFDNSLRRSGTAINKVLSKSMKDISYLHRSCKPLKDVVFEKSNDINNFENDCEGLCGV